MRLGTWLGALALGATMLVAGGAGAANACSIDGVPTLTVNGYTVAINKTVPTGTANLRLWAPFVLSFPLHSGRNEVLAEIANRVPLRLEAFKTPWRWNFGDGSKAARGMTVRHTFSKPGIYKVTVDAYFPSHHFWYTFDAVQVRVLHG